jgi:putative spermidine/putrescine transport system ATP-binding protein/mannopine transport system ATP-binding protein
LLLAVAGFDFPDSGRIEIGGEDVTSGPLRTSATSAWCFQRYTLFPRTIERGSTNIAVPLRMPEDVGRAQRQGTRAGALKDCPARRLWRIFCFRMPAQLSGGLQQRVRSRARYRLQSQGSC